ncbi:hypothetical protein CPHO_10205 [Corynebacterium phocae]|uniref:Uncharacterized protein n=2 Tax=Corynebacterium phocae TaxID=161895 RepID=A0A1L7D4Y2_9CORY|nr:hypothetical protein CPHO_10205 [Corynebacterium phocae]
MSVDMLRKLVGNADGLDTSQLVEASVKAAGKHRTSGPRGGFSSFGDFARDFGMELAAGMLSEFLLGFQDDHDQEADDRDELVKNTEKCAQTLDDVVHISGTAIAEILHATARMLDFLTGLLLRSHHPLMRTITPAIVAVGDKLIEDAHNWIAEQCRDRDTLIEICFEELEKCCEAACAAPEPKATPKIGECVPPEDPPEKVEPELPTTPQECPKQPPEVKEPEPAPKQCPPGVQPPGKPLVPPTQPVEPQQPVEPAAPTTPQGVCPPHQQPVQPDTAQPCPPDAVETSPAGTNPAQNPPAQNPPAQDPACSGPTGKPACPAPGVDGGEPEPTKPQQKPTPVECGEDSPATEEPKCNHEQTPDGTGQIEPPGTEAQGAAAQACTVECSCVGLLGAAGAGIVLIGLGVLIAGALECLAEMPIDLSQLPIDCETGAPEVEVPQPEPPVVPQQPVDLSQVPEPEPPAEKVAMMAGQNVSPQAGQAEHLAANGQADPKPAAPEQNHQEQGKGAADSSVRPRKAGQW